MTTGPYYVGLSRKTPIGDRLRMHRVDEHKDHWDRFSWFGFRPVMVNPEVDAKKAKCFLDGTATLGPLPTQLLTESKRAIGDIEALLIQSLGTQMRGNAVQMRFAAAQHWTQVAKHESEGFLNKVRSALP